MKAWNAHKLLMDSDKGLQYENANLMLNAGNNKQRTFSLKTKPKGKNDRTVSAGSDQK